jgi:UPF0716 protein FxsA
MMLALIILLSLVVPVLEVVIFSLIIQHVSVWVVVVPSVIASAAGGWILFKSLPKFLDKSMNDERSATFPTLNSYFQATNIVSGFLLVIPGFVTDLAGLLLLLPRFRGFSFIILSKLASTSKERIVRVDTGDEDSRRT